ncbi:MAG: type II toxin-antitoxin system VapC family toxin [Anaerolineae bacterium]|nr:type II toxin-antitoxin system VapC family toxin [Anaerolineae bacterium]
MTVVVDSNILIAFALTDEPLHTQASRLLRSWQTSETRLTAPSLFRSEITAVLRKVVFQQRISHEQGRILLRRLFAYPVVYIEDEALLESAYDFAQRFNRPRAYDSQYIALAERLNCEFWTADEVLVNSVQTRFSRIRWLGSFE